MIKNSKFTKFKKGDTVKIVAGKDKGKTGTIEKVLPRVSKVLVTGINQFKRHIKARTQNQVSEITTITKPITVASVMFVCPKCHLEARIGFVNQDGKKERMCKKCQQQI